MFIFKIKINYENEAINIHIYILSITAYEMHFNNIKHDANYSTNPCSICYIHDSWNIIFNITSLQMAIHCQQTSSNSVTTKRED